MLLWVAMARDPSAPVAEMPRGWPSVGIGVSLCGVLVQGNDDGV